VEDKKVAWKGLGRAGVGGAGTWGRASVGTAGHVGIAFSVRDWALHRLGLVAACPLPFLYRGGTGAYLFRPAARSH